MNNNINKDTYVPFKVEIVDGEVVVLLRDSVSGMVEEMPLSESMFSRDPEILSLLEEVKASASAPTSGVELEIPEEDEEDFSEFTDEETSETQTIDPNDKEQLLLDEEEEAGEVDTFRNFLSGIGLRDEDEFNEQERSINIQIREVLESYRTYRRYSFLWTSKKWAKDELGNWTPEALENQNRLRAMGVDIFEANMFESPEDAADAAAWQFAAAVAGKHGPRIVRLAKAALRGAGHPAGHETRRLLSTGSIQVFPTGEKKGGWTDANTTFFGRRLKDFEIPSENPEDGLKGRFRSDMALYEGMSNELMRGSLAFCADASWGRYTRADRGDPEYDGNEGITGYWGDTELQEQRRSEGQIVIPYMWIDDPSNPGNMIRVTQTHFKRYELTRTDNNGVPHFRLVDGWKLAVYFTILKSHVWTKESKASDFSDDDALPSRIPGNGKPKMLGGKMVTTYVSIWDHLDGLRTFINNFQKEIQGMRVLTSEEKLVKVQKEAELASVVWWFAMWKRLYRMYIGGAKYRSLNPLYKEYKNGSFDGMTIWVHGRLFTIRFSDYKQVRVALYPQLLKEMKYRQAKGETITLDEIALEKVQKDIRFRVMFFSKMSEKDMVEWRQKARNSIREDRKRSKELAEKAYLKKNPGFSIS